MNDLFLSIVTVVHNQADELPLLVPILQSTAAAIATDYEIVIIDNGSDDASLTVLQNLLQGAGTLPNIQVYALTKTVDLDTAQFAGAENALGDYVAVINTGTDDIRFLPSMLDKALQNHDVVFATNTQRTPQSLAYLLASSVFFLLYRLFGGIDLRTETPQFRLLSRRVVNYILQHDLPNTVYRHLPGTAGFTKANLSYEAVPTAAHRKQLGESFSRGLRLMIATSHAPMRIVTLLCLFGAVANVMYSSYVLLVYFFADNVAPGWTTLSLQQSGMFFLLSLVLLILGEHVLHIAAASLKKPLYYIGREFGSDSITRKQKLNVHERRQTLS